MNEGGEKNTSIRMSAEKVEHEGDNVIRFAIQTHKHS